MGADSQPFSSADQNRECSRRNRYAPLAEREFRPFHTLATAIISQQLSARAADTIKRRVSQIIPTPFSPDGFLSVPVDALRSAGLSTAKARYILELALRVIDGRLDFDNF